MYFALFILITAVCIIFYKGCHIVKESQRGLIESFGRYKKFAEPGFHWVLPLCRRLIVVNIAEQMLDIEPQLVITSDNLSALISAHVCIKVRADQDSVKGALYNSVDYASQTVKLARSALKNILGKIPLRRLSGDREVINAEMRRIIEAHTLKWGLEIIRVELDEIELPRDVQETMNKVVIAENERKAAADFAVMAEATAEGFRRSEIKKAEGLKQAKILAAEAEAKAIKTICDAAQQYFNGNGQLLKLLEISETALKSSTNAAQGSSRLVHTLEELSAMKPEERGQVYVK